MEWRDAQLFLLLGEGMKRSSIRRAARITDYFEDEIGLRARLCSCAQSVAQLSTSSIASPS